MAAGRFIVGPYFPARNRDGALVGGALLYVYENGTTTKSTIYSDESLSTLSPNPAVANSSGQFPPVWAEAGTTGDPTPFTVMVTGPDGESLGNPSTFTDFYPSLNWTNSEISLAEAAATAAEGFADDAEVSATDSETAATASEAALAEILEIAAAAPELPSIVNKANLNGDNVSGANATAFRTAIGAASQASQDDLWRSPLFHDDAYALRGSTTRVFENFDVDDTILNGRVCPTGQVWNVSGPGANIASISDGILVNNGANFYASLLYGSAVGSLGGAISFVPGPAPAGVLGPQCVLIAQRATLNLAEMIHCEFTPRGWSLKYWHNGASGVSVGDGTYDIPIDGTSYPVGMEVDGSTVTVIDPRGRRYSYTNSIFSDIAPTAGTIQVQVTASGADYVGRWHEFYMGTRNPSSLAVLSGAGSLGDTKQLMGVDYTRVKPSVTFTAGTTGWYRIVTAGTPSNFAITGIVDIYSKSADTTYLMYSAFVSVQGDAGGVVVNELNRTNKGSPVTTMRVSAQSDACGVDLYFANATSSTATVQVGFRGFGNLVFKPLVGATALSRTSSEINLVAPAATAPTTATISTSGWYRVAQATSAPFPGWCIESSFRILAYDAARGTSAVVTASARNTVAGVYLQQIECQQVQAGPVTQVRLSRDSADLSTTGVALDINLPTATANPVTLMIDWGDGYQAVVTTPVGGAVALTTEETTLTLANGRAKARTSTLGSYAMEDFAYVTLTDGGTYEVPQNVPGIQNLASGTLALSTVRLPDNPFNGQIVYVGTVGAITGLTVSPPDDPGGQTVSGAPTTLAAGGVFAMRFNSTTSVWYRHQ